MELSDLKQTLSTLSDEELFNLVKGVRSSRRTPKASSNAYKAKATKTAKASAPMSTDALLSALSPEQIEALIAQMEAKQ